MVSTVGIAVATAALVVVMSVFNGFHALIESRLGVFDAPLTVVPASGKTFADADSLSAVIAELPDVKMALPMVRERALAVVGERQTAVRLYGIRQELYDRFDSLTLAGVPWEECIPGLESAVVSVGVANELQVPIGLEYVMGLYVPRRVGRINPANPMAAFRTDSVAVSAAFALNQPEYDRDAVFAPLPLVRRLLQYTNEASVIQVFPNAGNEKAAESAVRSLIGDKGRVQTRMESQSGSFKVVNMEKWMTFLLLGFILIVASFNIVSSLSLLIIEKRENAQILAAIGLDRRAIRGIYMRCGVLISWTGGFVGMILGMLLSLGQQHFGWVKLASDPTLLSVTEYPVVFNAADLLPIAALIFILGIVSAAITSR